MNGSLRTNDFLERIFVVSSLTDDRKIYFAMVRWDGFGLDDLHVVFPDGAAAGLLLFAFCYKAIGSQATVDLACGFAGGRVAVSADSAKRDLEA